LLEDQVRDVQRLLSMPLFDMLREAFLEIRLVDELWEMDRERLGPSLRPIDGQDFDGAPRPERAGIELLGEAHEMTGLGIEMLAQLFVAAEILVIEQDVGADAAERAGQLIMVGVAALQAIVIDENLQFALAQCRAVEMRQVVD